MAGSYELSDAVSEAMPHSFSLQRSNLIYSCALGILRPLMSAFFSIDVSGKETIPETGPCLIAFKHITGFDPVLLSYATPRRTSCFGKKELAEKKVQGFFLRQLGLVPIDREAKRNSRDAYGYAQWLLEKGEVFTLAPEMTRTPGYVGTLHTGFITSYLRKHPSVPVIAAGIWYQDYHEYLSRGNVMQVRFEEADFKGLCLEERTNRLGRQLARLSNVEYLPEKAIKYSRKR